MANVFAFTRMNNQVKQMRKEITEELIDILTENGIPNGQIAITTDYIEIVLLKNNVKTTLFKHIDKYVGNEGEIFVTDNELHLKYIL